MSYIQTQPVGEYVSTSGVVGDIFGAIGDAFSTLGSASGGYQLTTDASGRLVATGLTTAMKNKFKTIQSGLNALGASLTIDGILGTNTANAWLQANAGGLRAASTDDQIRDMAANPDQYVTNIYAAVEAQPAAKQSASGQSFIALHQQTTSMLATITQSALFIPGLAALAIFAYLNRKALGFKGGKGGKGRGKKKGRR